MALAQTDILKKASKLYKKYGVRNVTMNDLSGELGISKKTLYQHIKHKETLIDMVLEADYFHLETLLGDIVLKINHPIEQFIELQLTLLKSLLESSNSVGFELKKYYPEKYHNYFNKYISLFTSILNQNISKGVESGMYRKNLNATLIVKAHIASILGGLDGDIGNPDIDLSEENSIESIRYHLRAMVTKQHIDSIDKYLRTIKPVLS